MRLLVRPRSTPAPEVAAPVAGPTDPGLGAPARNDPEAFALLYRSFFDQVYWYCFGRLGDAEAAEDATSQVFAKVLAALPRYEAREGTPSGSFRSWLFRIAHNVVVDELRIRRPHDPLAAAAELEAAGPTPEDEAIAAERHRLLRGLLARLPEDQRRVVELRLAGLSSAEIGAELGRRPAAVDTALWRAVSRLRALLAETGDHAEEGRDAAR
jgi:RNA polymerase sigma-70 factor (ECF subfamily)